MTEMENWRWVLVVCSLLLAPVMAVRDGWSYWQLTHDGAEASAAVTTKRVHHSRRSTSYEVSYRFRDSVGRSWTGSQRIPYQRYAVLRVSQPIQIVYYQPDPTVSVAYLDVLREDVGTLALVSFLLAVLAGSATWWLQYARRKTREYDAAEFGLAPKVAAD
jgi:hypothetical protein